MNYVVLHIDLEFIAGVVCTGDGNSYPITNGKDELLYLYFYNDPHTNKITFGKSNRDNVNREATNYYGKFFKIITDGHTSFKRGEFQKEAIELLQYSELLQTIKVKYSEVTKENTEDIHTLITFSLSISDLAKQKTVEYLRKQGFKIDSYTIPLAELVGYYPHSRKEFLPSNGSTIVLLAATNATLHIMKLVFSNSYFMLDGEMKRYEGMGIDPRKRALVGFVINQINITVGALNQNEIYTEIEKKEFKAEEWLRKIDAKSKNDNSPISITESLSPMPSCVRQVLVKKSDIETFTNDFVNLLMDHFNAFKNDNISGDIAGVFLIGDCFNNSLVRQRFKNLFRDEEECNKKLFSYTNTNIQDIISVYPKIDFRRYINEEERSKAKAEAEEKKIAEQRAIDAKKEEESKAEQAKIVAEKKREEIRNEAAKLYERAVELDNEGKLQDALANLKNAIEKDSNNIFYIEFLDKLTNKEQELKIRQEQYKSLIEKANKLIDNGKLESALNVFELAKEIDDNTFIRNNILETEHKIKELQQQQEKIKNLFANAKKLFNQNKFQEAKVEFENILRIESNNPEVKTKIKEIDSILRNIEIEFNTLIKVADSNFESKLFDAAINTYYSALNVKPNNAYCLMKIKAVEDKKKSLTPPAPPRPVGNTKPAPIRIPPPVPSRTVSSKASPPPPPTVPKKENFSSPNVTTTANNNSGKGVPPPPPPPKRK